MPALPQTRAPARVCTGTMHRPERDRGFSTSLQAKPPGSRSAAWGRRVAVNERISHAHGQVLPLEKTGQRLLALIKDVKLIVVEGGSHAIPWTHAAQGNTALLDFLGS